MILQGHEEFLLTPVALWVANTSADNIPELVKCIGIAPLSDLSTITFFIPEKFAAGFIANTQVNPDIALSATSVYSFESYQYKGVFMELRKCTSEEIDLQRQYLDGFTGVLASMGYSKESFYNSYFHQPSYAVRFSVTDIFDQTPYKGTGKLLSKKEGRHE